MEEFKDSPTALIADVDCTADGKELCTEHGVKGYPTIKHGNPSALEDYNGGRTFEELKKFAEENLGPVCGPGNLDLCSDEKKTLIEKYMKMSEGKIDAKIRKSEKQIQELEDAFETWQKGLMEQYEAKEKEKENALTTLKDSYPDLGLMKAVRSSRGGAESTKEDKEDKEDL